jgi:hypothetical protein
MEMIVFVDVSERKKWNLWELDVRGLLLDPTVLVLHRMKSF